MKKLWLLPTKSDFPLSSRPLPAEAAAVCASFAIGRILW